MEKEYTRTFSIVKPYKLIKGDTAQVEVCPFETYKINMSFCRFCEKWLPKDFQENEKASSELNNIIQEVEENAFCVGFKMTVNLMR